MCIYIHQQRTTKNPVLGGYTNAVGGHGGGRAR